MRVEQSACATRSRRTFLREAGLGLGACLWGLRGARGANARLAVGVVGVGPMGQFHADSLAQQPRVELRALCDVDADRLKAAVQRSGRRAHGYTDYRAMLADERLDALVIATPDHWHAAIARHAMQAGADVYVEKPLSWGVAEGREVVEMAQRLDRVVQLGTQQRGQSHFRQVVELIRSQRIGEVKLARCWKTGGGGGAFVPDCAPPPQLDWDRWLGPAPRRAYNPGLCHYNWRWHWDFGGGLLCDWGVHLVDIVHWALGQDTPKTVESTGTFDPRGSFETPLAQEVHWEYPGFNLHWSQNGFRGLPDKEYGLLFYGSKGKLFVDRQGFSVLPADLRLEPIGPRDYQLPRVKSHMEEFLDCVVTRERPTSDALTGHRSSLACTLGNLSLRVGRKLTWDGTRERFVYDSAADRLLARAPRAPYG